MGRRTLAAEVLGSTPWREPSQSLPLAPLKSPGRLHCWVAQAEQLTGREPSLTHQQSSGLKFYGALTATATVSSTHHQRLPSSPLGSLNHQRADSRSKKTTILQPVEQKPHLQKDRQDEKAEGYIPDEGTRKNLRKTTK